MPIMAMHLQSDARGAARMLARTALACIDDDDIGSSREVTLNNVYRLLEAFRTDSIFEDSSAGDFSNANSDLAFSRSRETHLSDVRAAIADAFQTTYANVERDQAINNVEAVLRSIAYPKKSLPLEEENRLLARDFFSKLIGRLAIEFSNVPA